MTSRRILKFLLLIGFLTFPICGFASECPANFKTNMEMLNFIKNQIIQKNSLLEDSLFLENIKIENIDFNSNGKSDRLISTLCGTGGCQYDIFLQTENGTYRYAGHAFFFSNSYKIVKNHDPKVIDMLAYGHSSATEGGLARYKISCNETKTVAEVLGPADELLPFVRDENQLANSNKVP